LVGDDTDESQIKFAAERETEMPMSAVKRRVEANPGGYELDAVIKGDLDNDNPYMNSSLNASITGI